MYDFFFILLALLALFFLIIIFVGTPVRYVMLRHDIKNSGKNEEEKKKAYRIENIGFLIWLCNCILIVVDFFEYITIQASYVC